MNNKNIGATISNLRKSKGYTQKKLSEIIYVSPKAISKWETGDGVPEITNLMELAKVFNVSVDYILQGLGSEGVENLETTHKRYNLLVADDEIVEAVLNVNENNINEDNKSLNKRLHKNISGVKEISNSEVTKGNNTEKNPEIPEVKGVDLNNNSTTSNKNKKEEKKKLSVDEIINLVNNAVDKSVDATKETFSLAGEAKNKRYINDFNNNENIESSSKGYVKNNTKGPVTHWISFIINMLLFALYIIFPNNSMLTIFTLFILFAIVVVSVTLSILALTGGKLDYLGKKLAIFNIVFSVVLIILEIINVYISYYSFFNYYTF